MAIAAAAGLASPPSVGGRSRLIAWCDVARTPWALRRWGIDANRARQRMHVVDAAGRVYGGAAAFGRLWRELPGHRSLGLLIGLPGIGLLAEGFYRLNLAVNPAYRDLGRASCGARHA